MDSIFFNHVAITINDVSEVEKFYINILGFEIKKQSSIPNDLAGQIFNISTPIKVITVRRNEFNLELFIDNKYKNNNLNHICLNYVDRKNLIKQVNENNYQCIVIKRDPFDMVFIRDKSNNLFEIKQQ
jgi:catechol 2,3-dioxygenase-like lactoylglutathione lyase family enzyme